MRFHQLPNHSHLTLWYPEKPRFVNEIHDHKEELGSSNELRKTCAPERQQRDSCEPSQQSYYWFFVQKDRHSYRWKEMDCCWRSTLHQEKVCLHRYPRRSRRWYVITHQDGSYHWETVKSVLLKVFAQEGAEQPADTCWIQLIQQGSSETRVEYFLDNKTSICYLRAVQGHSGGIPRRPEMMEYTCSAQLEGVHLSQEKKREWQSSTSSLLHTSELIRITALVGNTIKMQ